MKLRILSPGHRMPDWLQKGFREYQKRFLFPFSLTLCELPPEKKWPQRDRVRIPEQEGKTLLAARLPGHHTVALDMRGKSFSTEKLASLLEQWQQTAPGVDFLVGGAEGLAPVCLQQADCCWSLSALTLPHQLVRLLLAEQLYRATSFLRGHPYHRA